jgi:hypothetical protein
MLALACVDVADVRRFSHSLTWCPTCRRPPHPCIVQEPRPGGAGRERISAKGAGRYTARSADLQRSWNDCWGAKQLESSVSRMLADGLLMSFLGRRRPPTTSACFGSCWGIALDLGAARVGTRVAWESWRCS